MTTKDQKDHSYKFGGHELLELVGEISIKKSLGIEEVFSIVEKSVVIAAQSKYGNVVIGSHIDRHTGEISLMRKYKIVNDDLCEHVSDESNIDIIDVPHDCLGGDLKSDNITIEPSTETVATDNLFVDNNRYEGIIPLSKIVGDFPNIKNGDILRDKLPNVVNDRHGARLMRKSIMSFITTALRERQYKENLTRVGSIVAGIVRKILPNNKGYCIELNSMTEAFLPYNNSIKGEFFKTGDRIKALLEKVVRRDVGSQLILSRSSPTLLTQLFVQEVPEIYDKIVEIKAVARDAGSRSKIAVYSSNDNIDPIGSCIGIKGTRIRNISNELNGEKIDIVKYSTDNTQFIKNIFMPIDIKDVFFYDYEKKIEVVVSSDKLSLTIGRRGQNVSLASRLIDVPIDILDEEGVSQKRLVQFKEGYSNLVKELDVDEVVAQLLFAEGFFSVEMLLKADVADIASIEGFDYSIAQAIKERAKTCIEYKKILDLDKRFVEIDGLEPNIIVCIVNNSTVQSVQDLADMDSFELKDIILQNSSFDIDDDVINNIIISSRKIVGIIN